MLTLENTKPEMIANNLEPFAPTHPGTVVKDEIEYRGITQRKHAEQMCISYTLLNEVLNGKRAINTEFALLIEAILDIDASSLLSMQNRYDMSMTKKDSAFIDRLNKVRKLVAAF